MGIWAKNECAVESEWRKILKTLVFLYCFVNHLDSPWKLPLLTGFSLGQRPHEPHTCATAGGTYWWITPGMRGLSHCLTSGTFQNYFQPLTLTDGTYWVLCVSSAPFSAIVPCILLAVIKLSLPFWLLFTLLLNMQLLRHEHTKLFIQGHTRSQGPSQNLKILPDLSTCISQHPCFHTTFVQAFKAPSAHLFTASLLHKAVRYPQNDHHC